VCFFNSACNFSYGRFVFGGYFATEENGEKRGIREDFKEKRVLIAGWFLLVGFGVFGYYVY